MILSDDLAGQRQRRIEKLKELQKLGINAYPAQSKKEHSNKHILDNYESFAGKDVTLAGRLLNWRDHGKLMFADLHDQSGKIQIYIKNDVLPENDEKPYLGWQLLHLLDAGDFVQVTGEITKTTRGEISILAKHIQLLTKSIRPLPNRLHEKEQQFRRRYLDLVLNRERIELFERKAKFWQVAREFMHKNGFIEVETPVLEHVTGGADARPFVTHHNTLDQDFFMRISTELFQKRLIGGGFEKIFTLAPNFRNEGLSDEHLQEFYQLEWYWAYADYRDNMKLVADLFREVAKRVYGTTKFSTRGYEFDLADEWKEIDYVKIIKERFDIDIFTDETSKMLDVAQANQVKLDGDINRNRLIDNLWKIIRKELSGPAFLVNEPAFMSPLAKSKTDNPALTERFHVIIAGSELGNGYSEMNDPQDQLNRFIDQQKMRDNGDDEAQMLDIDFVEMLEFGMPPTSGYGQSERVFWFLENVTAREGTLFPQMKHEVEETTKKIYHDILQYIPNGQQKPKVDVVMPKTIVQPIQSDDVDYSKMYVEAVKIVDEYIKNDNLKRHCFDVAKCMRFYAKKCGADEDKWAVTGLLHDIDWEMYPDTHPNTAVPILEKLGLPKDVIDAILGHAHPIRTGVARTSELAHYLFACDELSGFIMAYSRMKPLTEIDPKGVIKKMKDKAFARNVSREDMTLGAAEIQLPIEEHIQNIIEALRG